jgi:hypothetical protein
MADADNNISAARRPTPTMNISTERLQAREYFPTVRFWAAAPWTTAVTYHRCGSTCFHIRRRRPRRTPITSPPLLSSPPSDSTVTSMDHVAEGDIRLPLVADRVTKYERNAAATSWRVADGRRRRYPWNPIYYQRWKQAVITKNGQSITLNNMQPVGGDIALIIGTNMRQSIGYGCRFVTIGNRGKSTNPSNEMRQNKTDVSSPVILN